MTEQRKKFEAWWKQGGWKVVGSRGVIGIKEDSWAAWQAAIAAAEAAQPVVSDAVTLLREIEWENNKWAECCPVCGEHKKDGHAVDCKLAAALSCPQPASAQPVAVPVDAIMQSFTEAWRLGQAMYQYASKNSKSALHKAHVTQLEFDELFNRVRAMLAAAPKPEGGE